MTTAQCHYKPCSERAIGTRPLVVGIARYGEVVVDPNGLVPRSYPEEDQVYVVLAGGGSLKYGSETVPLQKEDYLYIPAHAAQRWQTVFAAFPRNCHGLPNKGLRENAAPPNRCPPT